MGFFILLCMLNYIYFVQQPRKKEKKVQTVTKSDINGANIMEFVKRTKLEL